MGREALEAERSVLQQRNSDDFTNARVVEIAKALRLLQVNRELQVPGQWKMKIFFCEMLSRSVQKYPVKKPEFQSGESHAGDY
jgi:hypothetical protein